MYFPLAAAGLARTTLLITAVAFSTSLSGVNEIFPTGTWTSAVLSVRNSTLPALISFTAFAMSKVTVPVLGFRMRPFGPSTLPSLPTDFIMSGVEMTASKSVQLSFWIFSTISSPPTMSAPAASASRCFSPVAITRTFFDLPSPCGRTTVPRTIWSACLGSTPRRSVTSTVSSNLAYFTFCSSGTASLKRYWRFSIAARDLAMFFPALRLILSFSLSPTAFGISSAPWCYRFLANGFCLARLALWLIANCYLLPYDLNPHRPRRAFHALDRRLQRRGVQVRHLLLGDIGHLLLCDLADLVFIGRARTFGDARGPLQQNRGRRSLGDERERPVGIDRDHHRDNQPRHLLIGGAGIELFAELHDVDLRLAQGRTDRGSRRRLAGFNLQLNGCLYFFRCHLCLTWSFFVVAACAADALYLHQFLWHRHSCLCSSFKTCGPQAPSPANHSFSPQSISAQRVPSPCSGQNKNLRRYFLYLPKLQFHRRRAAKDRHHHFQGLAIFIHFIHRAVEVRKRPIGDADSFVLFELHANLGLVLAYVHAIDDLVDFVFGQRRGIVCRPHKTRNARRRLHHMPHMVAFATGAEPCQVHLHQHVSGIKHPLHGIFLAVADFRHRLRGNHDLADFFHQAKRLDARFQ